MIKSEYLYCLQPSFRLKVLKFIIVLPFQFSSKVILDRRHKEVGLSLSDVAHDIEFKIASACWDRCAAELAVDIFDGAGQARSMRISRHVLVVYNAITGVK